MMIVIISIFRIVNFSSTWDIRTKKGQLYMKTMPILHLISKIPKILRIALYGISPTAYKSMGMPFSCAHRLVIKEYSDSV